MCVNNVSEDFKKVYQKLNEANKQAYSDIESSFAYLEEAVTGLDSVKLLSQLNLTFLFIPENEFTEEGADAIKWARWIEFLAGLLLSKNYSGKTKTDIDGKDLENIENLLDDYFNNITKFLITSSPSSKDKRTERIINSAKNYSLHVRGESYPHQLKEVAQGIYSQHEDWFNKNLGFTISDALSISESITEEYNRRLNEARDWSLKHASEEVSELIKNKKVKEKDRKELETNASCYYLFGSSDAILSFTLEDLVRSSGFSEKTCSRYLERLSQVFGYRNAKFPDTFTNPHSAPWDYNTLYERPIILHNGKYFVPVPSLFLEVLLNTFYYDLISDDDYWKSEGEKKYGSWLEQKAASFLKRVFPESEIYLNPCYPNGDELCDVLVLHDRKVFIVQCKTKRLRYDSQIGKDFDSIKDDLSKGVKESYDQALRARNYFFDNKTAKIKLRDSELTVDSKQISDTFLMSVTLGNYQNLTTRLANTNPSLNLFSDNQYPWAVSLFDLGIITELIESSSIFIHYAKCRLAVERTSFELLADEIDLLGFYFSQGMSFEANDFKNISMASLDGFSKEIDRYIFDKYVCGKDSKKPAQEMPALFKDYLQCIDGLDLSYKTDCAIKLLDLDSKSREFFIDSVEQSKEKTISDNKIHSFSAVLGNNKIGFSFLSMNAKNDVEKLFQNVFSFAVMKKYATKCNEWVGFGWDKNSKNLLDVAIFLSFDWQEDQEIARVVKKNLRQVKMIKIRD